MPQCVKDMVTMSIPLNSPFLCPEFLIECEVIFLESIGLDDIAYQHAQFYDAVDMLKFQKFETERDRLNMLHDCKRLGLI